MFWQRRNETRASRACKVGQLGLEQLDARVVPSAGAVIGAGTAQLSVRFDEYGTAQATYGSRTLTPDSATKGGTLAYKLPVAVDEGYVNVYEHRGSREVSDVLQYVHTRDRSMDEYWLYVYSDKEERGHEPGNRADVGIPRNYRADSSVYEDDFGNAHYSARRADYYFYGDSKYVRESD